MPPTTIDSNQHDDDDDDKQQQEQQEQQEQQPQKHPETADDAAASKRRTEGQDFLERLRESSWVVYEPSPPDLRNAEETMSSDSNLAYNNNNNNNIGIDNGHRSNMSSLSADIFEHEILFVKEPNEITTTTTTTTTSNTLSPDSSSSSRPPLGRKPQSPLLESKLSPDKLRQTVGAAIASSSSSSSLPPKPPPLTLKHGRKVSWGKDQVERREQHHFASSPPQAPPQPQQQQQQQQQQSNRVIEKHILGTTTSESMGGVVVVGGGEYPSSSSVLRRLEPRKLTLDDVLKHGPFEDETQTGIIHSADERHYYNNNNNNNNGPTTTTTTRGRSDTGTSTIFTNVPDLISHEFEIYPMPTFLGMSLGDGEEEEEVEALSPSPHDPPPQPWSIKSGQDRSIHTTTTTTTTAAAAAARPLQESRPLIPTTKRSTTTSRHQRHMSVEQTLMSLTDAMSAVHGQHASSSHRRSHRRLHTGISIATNDFAHDALAVMAHPKQDDASDVQSHKSSGKSLRGGGGIGGIGIGFGKEGLVPSSSSFKPDAESIKSNLSISDTTTTNKKEEGMPRIESSDNLQGDDIETGNSDSEESLAYSLGNNNHPNNNNNNSNSNSNSSNQHKDGRKKLKKRGKRASTIETFKEDWDVWSEFFRPRRKRILAYIKCILFYFLLPALGIATILFYLRGNPTHNDTNTSKAGAPSSSYILLFCCRQVITFSMALAMQAFMIDFICLGTKLMLRLVGPVVTLLIVQSKGWPHIFFWWALFDFSMVSGAGAFAQHWAYYQKLIPLLNEENTSGNLVTSELYVRILTIVLSVSLVVAVKRFAIGLYLGRQTFSHYGLSLAEVMNKMLLVSKVASLAKEIEDEPSV
jgi:hypothetical protein